MMEPITVWSLIVGSVFLVAAFGEGPLKAIPLSLPAIYLAIGAFIGPWGFDLVQVDLFENAETIETMTEIGVLLSLLGAGLRLSPSLSHLKRADPPWLHRYVDDDSDDGRTRLRHQSRSSRRSREIVGTNSE